MIKYFVPTTVAPSKLDLLLADIHPQPLCKESSLKVTLLTDINRLCKLISGKIQTPEMFYSAYDKSVQYLEALQHNLQVDYNTKVYRDQIQGAEF